jgi:hypothetical protein
LPDASRHQRLFRRLWQSWRTDIRQPGITAIGAMLGVEFLVTLEVPIEVAEPVGCVREA